MREFQGKVKDTDTQEREGQDKERTKCEFDDIQNSQSRLSFESNELINREIASVSRKNRPTGIPEERQAHRYHM